MPQHKILIVDDYTTDRMKLQIGVKKLGHQAEAVASGPEALEKLRATQFDLVLLDLIMPEMDGFAVLEHIKADPATNAVPVVVVSSIEDDESLERATNLGAAGHLKKTFTPSDLQTMIDQTFG